MLMNICQKKWNSKIQQKISSKISSYFDFFDPFKKIMKNKCNFPENLKFLFFFKKFKKIFSFHHFCGSLSSFSWTKAIFVDATLKEIKGIYFFLKKIKNNNFLIFCCDFDWNFKFAAKNYKIVIFMFSSFCSKNKKC